MQAVVLVGGEGTRLRPLTDAVPKPALTLVDRPFLAYMIEWLAGHGVTEVVLACGFLPDVLRDALGDGERAGARVSYVVEAEPLGTAGAIRYAADQLGADLQDRFLALNGDVLTDLDLSALIRAHEACNATATIGLHPVDDASVYGLVQTGDGGEVVEFTEKTGRADPGDINAGMYVLERSVLDLMPPGEPLSIERDVFPQLVGNGLHGLRLDGYWMDIGTPERYLNASWDILERTVRTRVEPTAPGIFIAGGADVAEDAQVGPRAVVGEGCRLEAGCRIQGSVLLAGCEIGQGATVTGSILAPGVQVAAGATLDGAVVARNARVPA
jgi:mannose-1-phosphate guanylyltransferase